MMQIRLGDAIGSHIVILDRSTGLPITDLVFLDTETGECEQARRLPDGNLHTVLGPAGIPVLLTRQYVIEDFAVIPVGNIVHA